MERSEMLVTPGRQGMVGRAPRRRGSSGRSRADSRLGRGFFTGGNGPVKGDDGSRGAAVYKVVVPEQSLVVRIMGHDRRGSPEEYLPAVRPYGVLRMAWAIWREIPDVEPKGAVSLAWRVRREGEAVVFRATRVLAEFVQRRLLLRHYLRTHLERMG